MDYHTTFRLTETQQFQTSICNISLLFPLIRIPFALLLPLLIHIKKWKFLLNTFDPTIFLGSYEWQASSIYVVSTKMQPLVATSTQQCCGYLNTTMSSTKHKPL